MPKDKFNRAADPAAQPRPDGRPAPEELFARKIKTREMLDWLDARQPKTPAPELTPDSPAARAHGEHQNRLYALRQRRRFHQRSQKGREDFRRAHDFGREGREQEQER